VNEKAQQSRDEWLPSVLIYATVCPFLAVLAADKGSSPMMEGECRQKHWGGERLYSWNHLIAKTSSDIQYTDTALTGEHPEDIGRTVHAYVAY
jgi:hypothetical protein